VLHCQHGRDGVVWWLSEDGQRVKDEVAQLVSKNSAVASVGDALPLNINIPAQTCATSIGGPTMTIKILKPTATDDPFHPDNVRASQSFIDSAGVKKLLTTVPVHKPKRQDFIRVHPDADYRVDVAIIEVEEDRESYLVTPNAAVDLQNELQCKTLFTAMNRQGVVFLWPVIITTADARILEWHRSARETAETAMHKWVRVQANISLGAYEMWPAGGSIPDPEWPDVSFAELLRIAFRERFIDRLDHPVVKRLRGE
jgi:hypothetical protein